MQFNVILAGVGGQGILAIAKGISQAAMRAGLKVTQVEVHGMAQRGGAVQSHLRFANHDIHSGLIPHGEADLILATEPVEALRYVEYLRPHGCIISNTAPMVNIQNYPSVENILQRIAEFPDHVLINAERAARFAGSVLTTNSVILGAASAYLGIDPELLESTIAGFFERKGAAIVDTNRRAFRLGRALSEAYRDAIQRGAQPENVRRWIDSVPHGEWLNGQKPNAASLAVAAIASLTSAEEDAIAQVLHPAMQESRKRLFEHEVYALLELVGAIHPPHHVFVPVDDRLSGVELDEFAGERVVLKVVSADVVHKTEARGVRFVPKQRELVQQEIDLMIADQQKRGAKVAGVLVVEFVEADEHGFGQELFVGIRVTREFGPVIAAGFGGVDTELIAHSMSRGQAVAKALALDTTPEAFFERFKATTAYALLSGTARGHRRVVSDGELIRCFRSFLRLARNYCVPRPDGGVSIRELEVNPFALVQQKLVPLDGRAALGIIGDAPKPRPVEKVERMLEPRSIAMVGVSSQKLSFGRVILQNILDCGFPRQDLYIIKPNTNSIDGVQCVNSIADLPRAVDLMVITTASETVPELIREAISTARAESIVLIPGALGETEESKGIACDLRYILDRARESAGKGPIVLGPNCMGVRSLPGRYDTFFIPTEKLDPHRGRRALPLALITQSGAFAITRLSNLDHISPALTITLGNQMDLTIADLVRAVAPRPDVLCLGIYVEGFQDRDGLDFVRAVEEAVSLGKTVVCYKAGRTRPAHSAMSSHTASIAGDYDVCQAVVAQAGGIVCDTFKEFEQVVELSTLFGHVPVNGRRIGVITNAGFEAVGMADALSGARYQLELSDLASETLHKIQMCLRASGLDRLVTARNPLDLNPMATDDVYQTVIAAMLEDAEVDGLVLSVVPFTPKLLTTSEELKQPGALPQRLASYVKSSRKPIIAVLDCGSPFDSYATELRSAGIPVFPSCDQAVRSLGRYLCHRTAVNPVAEQADACPTPYTCSQSSPRSNLTCAPIPL